MNAAAAHVSLSQIVRPLLLLAAFGFLAGFGGYLVFGPPNAAGLIGRAQPAASAATPASIVSAPASADDDAWNPPRKT